MPTDARRRKRGSSSRELDTALQRVYRALHTVDALNLRTLRQCLGLSQVEAARLAGISTRTWIRYEQNRRRSPWNKALRSLLDNVLTHAKKTAA